MPPAQPSLPFVCHRRWQRQLRCISPRWLIQASCGLRPALPRSMDPLSPSLACPHTDTIPQGHSGLYLLQGGQIKPMVLLDSSVMQPALCQAPLTSQRDQAVSPHLQGHACLCPCYPFSPSGFRYPHSPGGGGTEICSRLWHRGGRVPQPGLSLPGPGGGESEEIDKGLP